MIMKRISTLACLGFTNVELREGNPTSIRIM